MANWLADVLGGAVGTSLSPEIPLAAFAVVYFGRTLGSLVLTFVLMLLLVVSFRAGFVRGFGFHDVGLIIAGLILCCLIGFGIRALYRRLTASAPAPAP